LIQLYWEIGEEIERQQREQGWGMSVVEILAKELQKEFPGVKGFSASNLWRMRSFYLEYSEKSNQQTIDVEKESTNLAPLVREIGGKITATISGRNKLVENMCYNRKMQR